MLQCQVGYYSLNNLFSSTQNCVFCGPPNKQLSYVTSAVAPLLSPTTPGTRWQRPEQRLQESTQNLTGTCRRWQTLPLTTACCSDRNENTPTRSWHHWRKISSQRLPLRHTLRESSQSAETCAVVNETSHKVLGTSRILENEQETCRLSA